MLYCRGNETRSHSVPASMNMCWPNNSYNGGQLVVWMCGSGIITADPTSVSQLADRALRPHIFHAAPGFSFYLSKRSLLLPASHSRQYNGHSRVSPQKQKFDWKQCLRNNKYIVFFSVFKFDLTDRVDAAGYKQINASLCDMVCSWFSASLHLREKQSSVAALSLRCYWFLIDSRNNWRGNHSEIKAQGAGTGQKGIVMCHEAEKHPQYTWPVCFPAELKGEIKHH